MEGEEEQTLLTNFTAKSSTQHDFKNSLVTIIKSAKQEKQLKSQCDFFGFDKLFQIDYTDMSMFEQNILYNILDFLLHDYLNPFVKLHVKNKKDNIAIELKTNFKGSFSYNFFSAFVKIAFFNLCASKPFKSLQHQKDNKTVFIHCQSRINPKPNADGFTNDVLILQQELYTLNIDTKELKCCNYNTIKSNVGGTYKVNFKFDGEIFL